MPVKMRSTSVALYALSLTTAVDAFFRINCAKILTGRVDPLVNPGAIAQHAHTIVGGSSKFKPRAYRQRAANTQ